MIYIEAVGGLIILLLGGDFLVRGAVALARRLGISTLLIGLTVVACGTSAPELVVSMNAALSGVPGIAIGNVVGSNVANVLLVLGIPAVIAPIARESGTARSYLFMFGASVAFVVLCWWGILVVWQGVVLLVLFAIFLFFSFRWARQGGGEAALAESEVEDIGVVPGSLGPALGITVGGLIGLVIGSHLLVDGASAIARAAGISEAVIGVTLVAFGTSLPELATSLMAALRRQGDVAIGNVIGSNLFNVLGVMGITATVVAVPVPAKFLSFDLWVMLAATLALAPFVFSRAPIGRVTGLVFALAYGGYVASQFFGMSGMSH